MKVLRLVSRRTKVFKSQKHVDVMFALNLFEHMRMQVGEMCSLNHRHPPPATLVKVPAPPFPAPPLNPLLLTIQSMYPLSVMLCSYRPPSTAS